MPPDDLFDDLDPQPPAAPSSPPPAAPKANGSAPPAQGGGNDAALAQVVQGLQNVGESLRAMNSRLDRVEGGLRKPAELPAANPANSDVLTELVSNPDKFLAERVGGVVKAQLEQLAPFLETVADGVTTSATERARTRFDADMGPGAFDKLVGPDLEKALAELPAASRAKGDYVNALVAGILGGKMMNEDGRKAVAETVRAARASRATPPEMLSGGGYSPAARNTISDAERVAIDSLRRSGIEFSEKAFLDAKSKGSSEEDWGADWAKNDRYWEGDDKPKGAAGAEGSE